MRLSEEKKGTRNISASLGSVTRTAMVRLPGVCITARTCCGVDRCHNRRRHRAALSIVNDHDFPIRSSIFKTALTLNPGDPVVHIAGIIVNKIGWTIIAD